MTATSHESIGYEFPIFELKYLLFNSIKPKLQIMRTYLTTNNDNV